MQADVQAEVRTHVVHSQLLKHIGPGATVVDVGGGDGRQSIPLSRLGHPVTIVEPSPLMREYARRRLEMESPEVGGRIRVLEGSSESSSDVVGSQKFEAVLCHGALPCVEDPSLFVDSLYSLAAPGACISVIAKSGAALPIMAAHHGRWREVVELFDADRVVNNMGVMTRADTIENLSCIVERLGGTVDAWYGIAFFTQGDSSPRNSISDDAFEAILAAEIEAVNAILFDN